ncbi:hypothetical protein C6P46_006071 [Rhodotorula mucilaginosa]|uniref:Ribosomal protein S17 n=1 Tax=Rhodotorula mucilaginosa TaxID=5537 RepID=A0A9P6VZK0_RHOMI|nr:hypothetical protein C6P46_006071 [Rhodotorula mucilaginosa]
MNTLLRTALHAPRPAAACTCTRAASSSASKYTLPNGLQLKGTVIAAGRMAQTVSVQVERRMTDHKTLKASTRPSFEIASTTDSADPHTPAQEYSRHTKFLVHDPDSACVVGDQVLIRNCRPVSARKRFELVQVTKGARERVESHHAPQGGAPPASTA